ncbi:MAG TPA: choice-of-anchor Q domain-containing protein [Streptosporangiaceae bacterium]|jgi:chitodextrinase|nr:choice-of-anchor Q domain-containing protein [Streptosporangiaceae bacterium]
MSAGAVVLIGGIAGSVAVSAPAFAQTPCTASALISAIASANSAGGTVTLTSGCTYTLTAVNTTADAGGVGLPVITGKVTIQGSGATIARSSASGTPAFRIFDVASSGSLTLESVTISNGLANNGQQGGGGIFNHGTLTITGSRFTGNSAPSSTGTSGGGINNSGTLKLSTSTFTGNTAQEGGGVFNQKTATVSGDTFADNTATIYGGGALLNAAGTMTVKGDTFTGNTGPGGGAIDNDATLNISDSTFTGNTGGTNGGGAIDNFGSTTITQATFSGNSSPYGANILNYTGYTLTIGMSIVANGQGGGPNCGGGQPVTDAGYNIDTGSSCGFSTASHSMNNTNPQLDPLADNGGPTQTMALPAGSPAVDAIPASTPGCTGSTDQRGITRPQGTGCDIGAYELVQSGSGTPSVPAGLQVTGTTSSSVSLSWNPSTGNPTGYTVYRNGKSVGSTGGPDATAYTDLTVSPSTTYTYTVDAFSGGNHSAQSSPVQATTPAPGGTAAVQGGAASTASQVTSTTITLSAPVHAGDLLVGWFGQYNSSGQVKVSDSVNGAWTRSTASTTFGGGSGDIALYYLQNSAAAPDGLTITISASSATYLEGAVGDYSGVATAGALDQVAVAKGNSTAVDSGPTGSVGAGELVVGGILTGGSPGTVTAGSSQGQTFTMLAHSSGLSSDLEDILSGAAGAQDARATLGTATDWYAVVATFHAFGSGNTTPPSVPTGLSDTSDTASSVGLSWNASTDSAGTLAGYTVYRNGTAIGTANAGTTTFTDSTVQPSTTYSYTVDAFDTAGNHSAQSSPLQVITPAAPPPSAHWVQGGAVSTGSQVTSVTITLTSPVSAGDLLVGWFGQYNSSGQVQVSDNVNGAWTRSGASTTFGSGSGDIALYYLQDSAAAPDGLTITITATSPTYLEAVAADYSGVATSGALDQTAVAKGNSASADSGPTASVSAGELVVGAILTGGSPGTVTPGSTQGQVFTMRSQTGSGSADLEDVLVCAAGAQDARASFSAATDWYAVVAVFRAS